jgi:hypothetical protein
MKYEEYETLGKGIIANPDTAPIAINGLLSEIKKDLASLDSLSAALEDSEKRIRDLQDTNTKLFLSQTAKSGPDEEQTWDKMAGNEALDAYIASKGEKT